MAIPPAPARSAPPGRPIRSIRPIRRRRLGAALVAAIGGIAILVAGLGQAAGGPPAGGPPGPGASSSPGVAAASPGATGSAPPGGPSVPPPASATPNPSSNPPPPPSAFPTRDERLQAQLDRIRARLGIPGVSVTMILPDGSTWSGASGLAEVATRTPVTPDTAFAYASMTKTFTSAVILQLVGEGRLRLADRAADLLPPLSVTIDRRITVGMLLNHTSGLADYFLNPKIDPPLQRRRSVAWTPDDALRYLGKRRSPPGGPFYYSNTNYLLLGLIVERVTGRTLAAEIRTRVLEPNGLDATWYQAVEPGRPTLAHGYRLPGTKRTVTPVDLADGTGIAPFRSVVTAAGGAGAMAGTSGDLARWARALYGGRVLGPDGTALLLSGFRTARGYVPGVTYGYGVQALSIDGHPSLGHSGRLLGFRGAVRHFPIDGLTIAVLTNQSRADPGLIVRSLLAVALPPAPPCPRCPMPR